MTLGIQPKAGYRGSEKTPERLAHEAPHKAQQQASMERRMSKGIMPATLGQLLRWYAEGWDAEVPTSIHKSDVWRDHGIHAEGGSKLGSLAYRDPFRRYLEDIASQTDEDGWFTLPMHAALERLGRRWPFGARTLFAVAQSGYDWRGVAERLHYADEFMHRYLQQALEDLWTEYREEIVRLV